MNTRWLIVASLCLGSTVAQSARASILYFDIADVTIGLGGPSTGIDFFLDGSSEFTLQCFNTSLPTGGFQHDFIVQGSTASCRTMVSGGFSTRFDVGSLIGSGAQTGASGMLFQELSGLERGEWSPTPRTGFVGLVTNGVAGPNFGWARVMVTPVTMTLYDFALEGVPFTPIAAGAVPAPGTASLLMLLAGVALRRRR
jgi:hypothetical protein